MSLPIRISDPATGLSADVTRILGGTSTRIGALVQTERFTQLNPEVHPFLNDSFGNAMNQNIAFTGTPEVIFDGAGGGWAGTANNGTWNFSDSGKVTITSADNTDSATFNDAGTGSINMSDHTAITGKVDLDIYNLSSNNIHVQFGLAGVLLGNSVDLNDYINTGDFAEQAFVIPKADLGIDNETVDEVTVTIFRTGGTKPTIKFDDWQIEELGNPAVFKATDLSPEKGKKFHLSEIRIQIVDGLAGTLADATMPALAYDQILGVAALTNGIVFQRVQKNKVLFSVTLRQLGDFLGTGSNIVNLISDGTNTALTMCVAFVEPIVIESGPEDFMSYTINDNLSGLLQFTASARGAVEI